MKIKSTLEAFYSARDVYGNCYWAMRYTDHKTGRVVEGTVTSGESNIYGILRETDAAVKANDWDRSVLFRCTELPKREFNKLTRSWAHAGCSSADLWAYIKKELKRHAAEARRALRLQIKAGGTD